MFEKILIPCIILLVGFSACNKNKTITPSFSGIEARDINAAPNGTTDADDWKLTDNWIAIEEALFSSSLNAKSLCTNNATISVAMYPNPTSNLGEIVLTAPATSSINLQIVNQQFVTIHSKQSTVSNGQTYVRSNFSFNDMGVAQQMVRAYYTISDSSGSCVYRGHGDIQVQ